MRCWITRCIHCNTVYTYYASGEPATHKHNDKDYCPECKRAIIETLDKIKPKFGKEFVVTDEVTYDELVKFEKSRKELTQIQIRKVLPSYYKDGYRIFTNEIEYQEKIYHILEYHKSEPIEISVNPLPLPEAKIWFIEPIFNKPIKNFEEAIERQNDVLGLKDRWESVLQEIEEKRGKTLSEAIKPSKIEIRVAKQKNLETNEIVGYWFDY